MIFFKLVFVKQYLTKAEPNVPVPPVINNDLFFNDINYSISKFLR